MAYEGLMVSVSGVRGRVGEALTPEIVAKFAAGFGAWAKQRARGKARIVVGRDSRVSGPMFQPVVISALQSVGCDVILVDMAPTPTIQLAVEHHHAAGGLAITASHNPIEWNALKFIGPSGLFLDGNEAAEMRAMVDGDIPRAKWDELGTVEPDADAVNRHIDMVLSLPFIDVEGIRARKYRVALDCVRGAGGAFMPMLLERLGCNVTAINLETDGRFPRPPEPIAENLGELEKLVRDSGAEVGFAVDPDVDRLALVSDEGKAIGEDYTLALAAKVVLRHREGNVVTNLSTSRIVDDIAKEQNRRVIRAPVGEVNVATRMRSENAPVGGEGNGGVILTEMHLGRDAPLGAAIILQLLLEDGKKLSEIVASYPRYSIVKDKLNRPSAPLDTVYASMKNAFSDAEIDTQDGLRLTWPDRWVHVRPSGTEPIVRVIAEAPTVGEAQALITKCREPLDKLK
ncbi:MAG TPA: phosphoglucosamine mutase [Gemmatimonadaceae bacterium]|jgi:phosphomannomutase|nr:phosphoglucosamine mutase [Gemmatimonadaceae bacterium]